MQPTTEPKNCLRDRLEEAVRNSQGIPIHTLEGLKGYIIDHHPPGHFLCNVLSNDLMGAVSRADACNLQCLPEIVRFVYNHAPRNCWGSREKVAAWLQHGQD